MKYLITLIAVCSLSFSYAQNVNWGSLDENQKNITYLNFGYDYGLTTQIGYARQIKWFKPLLINTDYSSPMGKDRIDDFKLRIGAQMPVYTLNSFQVTLRVQSILRKHKTELVQMANIGSEFSLLAGFYKPKWHLAMEGGYDQSTLTHLVHSDLMKEIYPVINDGWYEKTGGNIFYGIQASRKIGNKIDINLRTGATNARSTDEDALLPIYFQLGQNIRF